MSTAEIFRGVPGLSDLFTVTPQWSMRALMSPAGTSVAGAGTTHRSRSVSPRNSVVTRSSTGDDAPSLLPWLATVTKEAGLESRVALAQGPYGRSLVALRTLTPDEVIFNVPFSLVFGENDDASREEGEGSDGDLNDEKDSDLPWSATMAMRLLESRAGIHRPELKLWIDSLPTFVSTPPLEYTEDALTQCQDRVLIEEALSVKAAHEDAVEKLSSRLKNINCSGDDLRWATGALHSRCFTFGERGTHIAVPGVDMCNHVFENPNAYVRVVSSPEDCQGISATSEIAETNDDDATKNPQQFFQLRACEDGVEQGQEITISYGSWPNDPFFLYFGFVPGGNPNDAATLFKDEEDVAIFFEQMGLGEGIGSGNRSSGDAIQSGNQNENENERKRGMQLTRTGIDPAILKCCSTLGVEDWLVVVSEKCLEMLRACPTTLKEDRVLLSTESISDDERTSILYRISKKEVLLGPVAQARARESQIKEAQ